MYCDASASMLLLGNKIFFGYLDRLKCAFCVCISLYNISDMI